MSIKVIDTANGFEALEPGWNDLLEKFPYHDVSYSFPWYANWVRSFAADKRLRAVAIEKDDQLVSVLPLYEEKVAYSNLQVRVLKSMTNCHSNRFDILALDDSGELLATTIAAAFAESRQQIMVLDHVPADSYIMQWISKVCGDMKWHYTVSEHSTNYQVKPAPTFSDYYNSLDGKFRKNVNAALRKAQARGCLTLQTLTGTDELESILARGFALEASGWKGEQGTAIVCSNQTRQFYEGIARDFQQHGKFMAFLLENNGDDIAFLFCIAGFGTVRALKIGVNGALRSLAPGMLITKNVLEYVHNIGGINIWDFCGGEARWKRDWGNTSEKLYRVDIFNNGFLGTAFHKLLVLGRDLKKTNGVVGKMLNSRANKSKGE